MRPTLGKTSRTWKAWTGLAPDGALAFEPAPVGLPEPRPEAQPQRLAEQVRRHPIEERAAQPVGLDDPPVERVRDRVRSRDELEIGICALEAARQLAELALVVAVARLAEEASASSGPHRPRRFGP